MMKIKEKIFKLVARIPKGKVTTYKAIATARGVGPRQVGTVLHENRDPKNIPCHRVVKSDGRLAEGYAFGGKTAQKKKLESEGIKFIKGKIDLKTYGFFF